MVLFTIYGTVRCVLYASIAFTRQGRPRSLPRVRGRGTAVWRWMRFFRQLRKTDGIEDDKYLSLYQTMPVMRRILLLMLCRNERKRAVLKQDDGWLCVETVPEEIEKDKVLVVWTRQIDKETLEPASFEGFAFVESEVLF